MSESSKDERFEPNAVFWGTWGGRVVRSIVLHDAYTRDTIQKTTNLKEQEFNQAIKALSEDNLLQEKENGTLWVTSELYGKCKFFFENSQSALLNWVKDWRKTKINSLLESESSHFYLAGKMLSTFSENLIENAKEEILVANPFVKRCDISQALMVMGEKGVNVKLVTRGIGTEQFRKELTKIVMTSLDESIHAKLIVTDKCVGIVSSMNFYAGSSAGECWEAGIVTTDWKIVQSIASSILSKIPSEKI